MGVRARTMVEVRVEEMMPWLSAANPAIGVEGRFAIVPKVSTEATRHLSPTPG